MAKKLDDPNESAMARAARILFYILATPRNLSVMSKPPVVVWTSKPGNGKSVFARLVANSLDIADDHYVRYNASGLADVDFKGMPWPHDHGVRYLIDERLLPVLDGAPALIVYDEAGNMLRSTQAASLCLFDSGMLGPHTLPASCGILLMMNPPDSGTDASDLALALTNRANFQHFGGPTDREFANFMAARGKVPMPAMPDRSIIAAAYPTTLAMLASLHEAFLANQTLGGTKEEDCDSDEVRARMSSLQTTDDGEKIYQPVYATPRSVEVGLNQAATALCYGDWPAAIDIMCGSFGRTQGMKFGAFAMEQDVVNPVALLKGEVAWKHDPKRPDRTQAQSLACATVATDGSMKGDPMKWWNSCWSVLNDARKAGAEDGLLTTAAERLGYHKPKGALLAEHADIIHALAPFVSAYVHGV